MNKDIEDFLVLLELIKREGKTQQITATLRNIEGQMELIQPQEVFLGATFREVSSDLKEKLDIPNGVQVTGIRPGKFMSAGIREGFIIVMINDNHVETPSDIGDILENYEGGVYIEGVYPDGTVQYYAFGL